MRPRGRGQAGFTMIEMIMVIILLGILVVAAAPKFMQTSDFSVDGAAAMVASDLRYARELAMATHTAQSVSFTSGAATYTVTWQSNPVRLPGRVTVTSANVTFTFNTLGEPTAGGGSAVTLGEGGVTKTVRVENYTGAVSIS